MDPKRKRIDFKEKRFIDSGVWMGSDESGAESLLLSEDAPGWAEDLIKSARESNAIGNPPGALRQQYQATAQSHNAFKKSEEPEGHRFCRTVVNDCLEKGRDSVDLRLVLCFRGSYCY